MRGAIGVDHTATDRFARQELFGLSLQLALHFAGGLDGGLKTRLRLRVAQIHKSRIQLIRNGYGLGETLSHLPRHTHDPPNELHRKVHIVHGFGAGQHKRPGCIKTCARRLLENQHLFRGVVGNRGHQDRVRLIGRMFANHVGVHVAVVHQVLCRIVHRIRTIAHLHQKQRHTSHALLTQLLANQHIARPCLAQHRASHVCDLLHCSA